MAHVATPTSEALSDRHNGKAGLLRNARVSVPVVWRQHQSRMRPRAATEGRPAHVHSLVIFWVGLDVHKDSITAAVFRGRDPEPLRVDRILNDPKRFRRYFERLQREGEARACYEASGAGYVLQRMLIEWCIPCELAAPSMILRRAGEHRKTDRRDAIKIARDFRDDRLVLIHFPTEKEEGVRDLVRCRETFQREILKSRHYILKILRRRGFIYREGTHWTTRHVLVQAAWHYRKRPAVGPSLRRRQQDQDAAVIAHAWKCQHRLYKLFHRLAAKEPKQVAATAVVREMVGFLPAVLREVDASELQMGR